MNVDKAEVCVTDLRFWWSCEQYCATEEPEKRVTLANEIWQRHLAERASEPVNVDAAARRAAALLLYHDPPPPELFQQVYVLEHYEILLLYTKVDYCLVASYYFW